MVERKEPPVAASDPVPVFGKTNPSAEQKKHMRLKRFGSVIGLDPEKEQYYRELHADVWPTIVDRIRQSNIQNYSIYVTEIRGQKYLFSYFEYVGTDLEADMKAMADDPETQRWWQETDPCQIQLPGRQPGANWSDMEMVFFIE
jgi:L-rhamnose mutarotase